MKFIKAHFVEIVMGIVLAIISGIVVCNIFNEPAKIPNKSHNQNQ